MTNHAQGSSLVQTRNSLPHSHSHYDAHHLHRKDGAAIIDGHHLHLHHQRQHNQHVRSNAVAPSALADSDADPVADNDDDDVLQLRRRQEDQAAADDLDQAVTRVVQTVSVIQYIDGTGAVLDVSTLSTPPLTQVVDGQTSATLDPSSVDPLPTSDTAVVVPGSTAAASSYQTLYSSFDVSSAPSAASTTLSPVPSPSLTSTPLLNSSSTTFPSFSGALNSTSASVSASAASPFSNSTIRNFFFNSTASQTSLYTSITSLTSLTSTTTSSSWKSTSTDLAGGSGGPWRTGSGASPTGSADDGSGTAASASTPQSTTPTSTLVASVVGGICGIALLVFAAFFVLRWRKQQQNGHRLLGDGDADGNPSSGQATGSRDGRGFSRRMSERGGSFSVPAALAALSGGSAKQQPAIEAAGDETTGERGFYRVSGRKLPSVFQHGGDGFSNPHDSTMSGASFYRDSQFYGGPDSEGMLPSRLAVGSPMRPESGVPVIHPGPARTPVTQLSPVLTPSPTLSPLTPPPPRRDPLGRSHPSQDGSRGSASRFSENMA